MLLRRAGLTASAGLSCSIIYTRVTDRRTDGRAIAYTRYSMLLRVKTETKH